MHTKKKILAISGSTKKGSSNESILRYIAATYQQVAAVELWDGVDKLPHFNPGLEGEEVPASVKELRDRIAAADGVIICTPEYVFSLPGSLKNAIEWCVSTTVFSNKALALIVAAASGEKALESLLLIMTTLEARIAPASSLLIKGVKGKVGPAGEIKHPETAVNIKAVVDSLLQSLAEENPRPNKYRLE